MTSVFSRNSLIKERKTRFSKKYKLYSHRNTRCVQSSMCTTCADGTSRHATPTQSMKYIHIYNIYTPRPCGKKKICTHLKYIHTTVVISPTQSLDTPRQLKGGPEPLKKEINEILDSKREDRFSNPFFELVQNTTSVRFSYLLRLCDFCKAPRDMRKFHRSARRQPGVEGAPFMYVIQGHVTSDHG